MSKVIEFIEKKTNYILEQLDHLKKTNQEEDLASKNTHPIYCAYLSYGNNFNEMQDRVFEDPEEVLYCLKQYQNIMAEINKTDVFIPSIESFCMFMGWTAKIYKRMSQSELQDIADTMQMVDDYIIESQLSAGQGGFAKANLTKFRAQVAGLHGNALVTQKEQNEENRAMKKIKSPEQLQKELDKMGANILTNKQEH